MKARVQFILLAILTLGLSMTALADVKVKTRSTMSGQTYEGTTYIKGKRQRDEQNMGGMETVSITQCDLKRGIQLNPQSQIYIINAWDNDATVPTQTTVNGNTKTEVKKGGVVTMTVTTKDTGETRKMFGYTARHLIITTETDSSPDACSKMKSKMVTDGWYIDAAFALDCDYKGAGGYGGGGYSGGCRDRYEFKQAGVTTKRGFPVIEKTTMYDESGKESFTMTKEVVELSSATLDQALFEIPQGWREAKDQSEMYASVSRPTSSSYSSTSSSSTTSSMTMPSTTSGLGSTAKTMSQMDEEANSSATLEPKKPGTIRIGLANVKTGAVGEGLNAAELAQAIQNTLPQYMKGTKVEIVQLEAKLASALDAEAKERECDYVLFLTASHKKGGGGFGMFGKALGNVVAQTGGGSWGNTAANNVGRIAAGTIVAATVSQNVKAKDELSLDVNLTKSSASVLSKQFKAKAKGDGDDIISQVVEQAATAIIAAAK